MATVNLKVGQRVMIVGKNMKGTIQYIGEPKFAPGKWIGVELDEPQGKNNGSLQGEVYFSCAENHGVFVKQTQVAALPSTDKPPRPVSSGSPLPSSPSPSVPSTPIKASAATTAAAAAPPRSTTKSTTAAPPTTATAPPSTVKAAAVAKIPIATAQPGSEDVTPPSQSPAPPADPIPTSTTTTAATLAPSHTFTVSGSGAGANVGVSKSSASPSSNLPVRDAAADEKIASLEDQVSKLTARVNESERYRAQYEQLVEFKQRWLASQETLQTQLAATTQELSTQKDKFESEMAVLHETAEMSTVDKEIAEEKCRDLEEQLDKLKESIDEMKLSKEVSQSGGSGGGDVVNSGAFKELSAQNQRLKEALVRLKEQSDLAMTDASIAQEELMAIKVERDTLKTQYDAKVVALQAAQVSVAQAKDQLDAASSVEALVEKLTDKNLALEDRARKLTEQVADMQALLDMNDEIEEARTSSESTLKEDLEQSVARCLKLEDALELLGNQNSEYAEAIEKYKQKLASVEGEATDIRVQKSDQQTAALAEQAKNMQVMAMKLAERTSKEREKQLTMQLHKLDADQAVEHIAMIRAFLPESTFAADADGLRLLLLMERLVAKSDMIAQYVRQLYRLDEEMDRVMEGREITTDQWAFAHDVNELMNTILVEARYCVTGLEQCSVEVFHSLAAVYPEVSRLETGLDGLLNRITGDGLDPSYPIEDLRTSCRQLQHITLTHLRTTHPLPPVGHLRDGATVMLAISDAVDGQLHILRNFIAHSGPDGLVDHAFDLMVSHVTEAIETARQIKRSSHKIIRRMPDGKETTLVFDDKVRATVTDVVSEFREVHSTLRTTNAAIWKHIHTTRRSLTLDAAVHLGIESRLDLTENGEFVAKAIANGAERNQIPVAPFKSLASVRECVGTLANAVADGDYDKPATVMAKTERPWEVRAKEMRKALAENLGLGTLVEKKQQEIKELKMALKIKEKECADQSEVLLGLSQRGEAAKADLAKQLASTEAARSDFEKRLQRKEAELEETTRALEQEVHAAETERDELRKKMEKGGYGKSLAVGTADASSADVRAARLQAEMLNQTVTELRSELAKARARQLNDVLGDLPLLHLPTANIPASQALSTVSGLVREVSSLAAAPVVIDITAESKKSARSQLLAQANTIAALNTSTRRLAAETHNAQVRALQDAAAVANNLLVGKVVLPAGVSALTAAPVVLSSGQLEQLHAVLVQ